LLFAISGNLFLAVFVLGLGIYTWMSHIEQRQWQARLADRTQEMSLLVQQYSENKQDVLSTIGAMQGQSTAQALQSLVAQNHEWMEAALLDSNGVLIAGTASEDAMMQDAAANLQSRWFQQARIGTATFDILLASQPETPYLIAAVPAANGGVIAGRVRADQLMDSIAAYQTGQNGSAYLINRQDGRVFAGPGLNQNASDSESEVYKTILGQPEQAWQTVLSNSQGAKSLAQAAPIANTSWIAVTELSQKEAAAFSRQMLPYTAGALLLVWVMLTFLVNASLDVMLVRPLQSILEGKEIPARTDEIGQIANRVRQSDASAFEKNEMIVKARRQVMLDSQFRTDFLGRVSHDLRQPMGVILGFSEMLSEEIFGAINRQQRRAVEDILTSTKQLSRMISDLLDTSQLEAQTMHVRSDEFLPELLMRQAVGQVQILADRKELQLTTSIDPELPKTILGDANRIQQIVYNLAVNAIKFTQKGTIAIRFHRFAEDQWVIGVSDTGQGIPEDALEYIFEPFRQVSSQTTRDKGGVGLGLYIVQQLVLLMGGQVQVESVVGSGSTFTVTLPLQTVAKKEDTPCPPQLPA